MVWDVSPILLSWGPIQLRWYGIFFAMIFLVGFEIVAWTFRREGKNENDLNSLLVYTMIGTIGGARLGHCLFYEPQIYLADPIRIFKIWEGGLASHGGTAGIILALYLYSRKHPDQKWLWILDRMALATAIGAFFIRVGNFFNSEIIGRPADVPWAIIFARVSPIPRHPSQLYEAVINLITFVVLIQIYRRYQEQTPRGLILGWLLISIFGARFFLEYWKENQVAFESGLWINMGQILSVPFVIAGIVLVIRSRKIPLN